MACAIFLLSRAALDTVLQRRGHDVSSIKVFSKQKMRVVQTKGD